MAIYVSPPAFNTAIQFNWSNDFSSESQDWVNFMK